MLTFAQSVARGKGQVSEHSPLTPLQVGHRENSHVCVLHSAVSSSESVWRTNTALDDMPGAAVSQFSLWVHTKDSSKVQCQ